MKLQTLSIIACTLLAASAGAQSNSPLPRVPPPPPNPQDLSQIRFAYGGNVAQIPAKFVNNLVFVPVTINQGEPSLFLLDSTAPASSIDPRRAAALGLADATSSGAVHDVLLTLPGVGWMVPSLPMLSRDGLTPRIGRPYQGTLGLDFLSRVVVTIDYSRHSVQIFAPDAYTPPDKKLIQPVHWTSGLPYVSCKFSVRGEHASTASFLVDSAQAAGIVFRDRYVSSHARNFEHLKTIPGLFGQEAGEVSAAIGRLNSFAIDRFGLPNMIATLPHAPIEDESNSSAAGIIGAAYLRRFVLIFDLPHQQIIFQPNINFVDRDDVGMTGITLLARGANLKTFEVAFVVPGSPAAQAGVQQGDIIAGINDEPAADLTLDQIQDLFGQIEMKYKLLIERGERTLTVNIQTKRLI